MAARDACVAEGLSLCSREQLDRVCAQDPTVGALETWTTSFAGNGQLWTRGGSSCAQHSAADPTDAKASRGGLCCDRKPAIEIASQRKGDALQKAINVYMLMVQEAMNSRDPEKVLPLVASDFLLYSQKQRMNHQTGAKALAFDLGNGTEFDNHLVRCGGVIEGAGKHGGFVCQTVTVRKMNTKPSRELALMDLEFRFIPPVLKYDVWAVGTNIVRNFAPIDAPSNSAIPAGASDGLLTPMAAALLTSGTQPPSGSALTPAERAQALKAAGLSAQGSLVVNPCGVAVEPGIDTIDVGGPVGWVVVINLDGPDESHTMECSPGGTSYVLRRNGASFQKILGSAGAIGIHRERHQGVAALLTSGRGACNGVWRWNGKAYESWKREGPTCAMLE